MNPPLQTVSAQPERQRKLLCVYPQDRCLGALVTALLRCHAPWLTVRSAGMEGIANAPVHPNALLAGVSRGLDLWGHRSRVLRERDCAWADLVLVQRPQDMDRVARWLPEQSHKLRLLDRGAQLPVEQRIAFTEAQMREALTVMDAVAREWAASLSQPSENTAT